MNPLTVSLFDQGPSAPCPPQFNLAAYVLSLADAQPDKPALGILGANGARFWSYSALKTAVLGTATGLLAQGLTRGDIVLLRLGNTVDFPLAYLGAIAAGLIPVPTSSQLSEVEVSAMITALKPALILKSDGVACPTDCGLPVIGETALEAMQSLPPAAFDMGDPNRLAYIIYTSGTSGTPRAVGHAHRAIWARRMMFEGWYDLRKSDRMFHAGAFNWTYTLGTGLMDPWSMGATALIPEAGMDLHQIPNLLKQYDATIFAAAPGVYRKIMSRDMPALPHLRHGLAAGEKLSAQIRANWNTATGTNIYEAFGMSECSTFISGSPAHPAQDGALGQPQQGRRVAIVDNNGPVTIGIEGTIAIDRRDPGLMIEYIGAQAETAAKMQGDWFLTGDRAVMATDGQITYLGRRDDMMNAGGYRVSPLEVEATMLAHPDVDEIGVTDIEVKPDVRIIIALYTSQIAIPEDRLLKFAAQNLARYKCPRVFMRVETLPRGANSKLLRRAMAPIYEVNK